MSGCCFLLFLEGAGEVVRSSSGRTVTFFGFFLANEPAIGQAGLEIRPLHVFVDFHQLQQLSVFFHFLFLLVFRSLCSCSCPS